MVEIQIKRTESDLSSMKTKMNEIEARVKRTESDLAKVGALEENLSSMETKMKETEANLTMKIMGVQDNLNKLVP